MATHEDMEDVNKEGFYIARVSKFPDSIYSYEKAIRKSEDLVHDVVDTSVEENENTLRVEDFMLITYAREFESDRYVKNHMRHSREPDVQRSSIELKTGSTVFHDHGFLYDAYDVVLHGYMAWERMAEMLPLDYNPADS